MTAGPGDPVALPARRESVWAFLHRPLLAPLISRRGTAIALVAACGLQATLVACRLPAMPCPVPQLFGVPCPGCGLTRASVALAQGRFADAAATHLFSFAAVVAGTIVVISIPLPPPARQRLADAVERVERRTAVSGLTLAALFIYWIARYLYGDPVAVS